MKKVYLFWWLIVCLCIGVFGAEGKNTNTRFIVNEVSLGKVPPRIVIRNVQVSPDGKRIVYVTRQGEKSFFVIVTLSAPTIIYFWGKNLKIQLKKFMPNFQSWIKINVSNVAYVLKIAGQVPFFNLQENSLFSFTNFARAVVCVGTFVLIRPLGLKKK